MPTLTNDRNLNASYAKTFFSVPVDYHLVMSASLFDIDEGSVPNEIFAEIGLMTGTNASHIRIAVLASGVMGGRVNIGWSGRLPTEPGSRIYCSAYGPDDRDVRLTVTLWRIVTTEDGRFVLDP